MDDNKISNVPDPEKASLVDLKPLPQVISSNYPESADAKNPIDHVDPKLERGSSFKQVAAALVAQLGTINTGLVFGFSAIALPQMKAVNSTFPITRDEESWIASINAIGTPIGCLLSGYLMDTLGRKMTLIVTEVPALLGWILIACGTNMDMLYAGRFFTGFGSGMVGAPARVYAGEATQPHLRGMLTALSSVGVSTGVFLVYILGSLLSWHVVATINAVVPLISLILILLFPETPSFLISRNKPTKARKALQRLRGSTCNLEKEMGNLIGFAEKNNVKRLTSPLDIIRALIKPNAIKPFIMLTLYFLIYQWSGTNTITFYAVEILESAGSTMNKNLLTVILGTVRLICTVIACVLCRRCGRRPLTFISSIGCGLSMLGLGLYKVYVTTPQSSYSWFPVMCIFTYTIACTLGFLIIPWVMIGEVYPVQVRGVIGGMTTMMAHLTVFTVVKTFPMLKASITDSWTFVLYGVISLIGTIYFWIFLPETKGRTLQEIEDYFSGRTKTLGSSKAQNTPQVLELKKDQSLP